MGSVERVGAIASRFASQGVDYKIVYITEAHPRDGWLNRVAPAQFKSIQYARSLDERMDTARRFAGKLGVEEGNVLVDGMADALEHGYEARPERLYVLRGGKVLWRCGPGPYEYDMQGLEEFLAQHV